MNLTSWLAQHARLEKELAKDLRKFFRVQYESIQNGVRIFGVNTPSVLLFTPNAWNTTLRETVRPTLLKCAIAGAMTERKKFGKSQKNAYEDVYVDLPLSVQLAMREAVQNVLNEPYWADINQTTLERLERALIESIDEGWSMAQVANRISRSLGEEAGSIRAYTIARTETTGMLNAGHYVQRNEFAEEGIVDGSEWSSVIDDHTRRLPRDRFDHVRMDGQRIGNNELFNVSGELAPYPGYHKLSAGNRVFCRCTTLSVTAGRADWRRGVCRAHRGSTLIAVHRAY
jgi:hypothetical protein